MKSRDVLCLTCGFLAGVVATAGIAVYAAKKTFEFFNVGLIKDKMADVCLTAIYGAPCKEKGDKFYQYKRPYYGLWESYANKTAKRFYSEQNDNLRKKMEEEYGI